MRKIVSTALVLLLIGLISMFTIRQTLADITSTSWIMPAWRNKSDSYFGTTVPIAYVSGSQWMLNVLVYGDATNGTNDMDARVSKIAVWFDWNLFYNTTVDVTVKHGSSHLFSINGTTEQTSTASNLFLHTYKIYVEYSIVYLKDGATVTENRVWGPVGPGSPSFAVLTQDQYSADQATKNYNDFRNQISGLVDSYAESLSVYIQATLEAKMGETSYNGGDFTTALAHYDNAISYLNQSMITYTTKAAASEQAGIDMTQAQIDAIKANSTARLVEANGLATAMMVNSFALALFGLGFIFFGLAAIFYARRPRPAPT